MGAEGRTFSRSEVLLLFFSLFYALADTYYGGLSLRGCALYLLGPWVFYRLGKAYALHTGSCSGFCQLLAAPSLGMWLHGLLNWLAASAGREALPAQNRCGLLAGEPVSVTCTGMLLTAAAALALGRLCSQERPPANGPPSSVWGLPGRKRVFCQPYPAPSVRPAPGRTGLEIASAPHRGASSRRCAGILFALLFLAPGPPENALGPGQLALSPTPDPAAPEPGGGAVPLEIWSAFFRGGRWLHFP